MENKTLDRSPDSASGDGGRQQKLSEMSAFSKQVAEEIKARYAEVPYEQKRKPSADEFTMYLGFLSAIRKVPGFEHPIGLDDLYKKYRGREKDAVKRFLADYYELTDAESFYRVYMQRRDNNISPMVKNVLTYLDGKPDFDISRLNENGRRFFDNATAFVKCFAEYLPKEDILAWDICEKMSFARLSFSCGIIDKRMFADCITSLNDKARQCFSSFEEYMRSLIFGCGFYAFTGDEDVVKAAMEFMGNMLPLLLKSDIADLQWLK